MAGGRIWLVYTFTPMILGKLTSHMDRKITLLVALGALMLISLIFAAFFRTVIQFIIGQALFGLVYSLYWPASEALTSEQTGRIGCSHSRGILNYCVGWGLGEVFGSPFGSLVSTFAIQFVLLIIFGMYVISTVIAFFGIPSKSKESKNNYELIDQKPLLSEQEQMRTKARVTRHCNAII